MRYYVYILCNRWRTVFYTGVTDNLARRTHEHKTKQMKGFTNRYNVDILVYFEEFTDAQAASHRERLIKKWKREFKIDAINRMNPSWRDLYIEIAGDPATSAGCKP